MGGPKQCLMSSLYTAVNILLWIHFRDEIKSPGKISILRELTGNVLRGSRAVAGLR